MMTVSLSPEIERLVNESISTGKFSSREDFFNQAAHLLLARLNAEPIPVDGQWNARVDTLLDEAEASGEGTELNDEDWHEIERQGLALIQQRKKA